MTGMRANPLLKVAPETHFLANGVMSNVHVDVLFLPWTQSPLSTPLRSRGSVGTGVVGSSAFRSAGGAPSVLPHPTVTRHASMAAAASLNVAGAFGCWSGGP